MGGSKVSNGSLTRFAEDHEASHVIDDSHDLHMFRMGDAAPSNSIVPVKSRSCERCSLPVRLVGTETENKNRGVVSIR